MATRKHALYRLLPTPAPDAAHGACYLTGNAGPCIDTGINIDFEGTLTISLSALKELCEVAGFSFDAEAAKLEDHNSFLLHENASLAETVREQREELDAVGRLLASAQSRQVTVNKAK